MSADELAIKGEQTSETTVGYRRTGRREETVDRPMIVRRSRLRTSAGLWEAAGRHRHETGQMDRGEEVRMKMHFSALSAQLGDHG